MFRQSSSVPFFLVAALVTSASCAWAGTPTTEVVIAKDAGALEQFAAAELQRYLGRLFGVSAKTVLAPTATAGNLFLVGTSTRHPCRSLGEAALPTLSDQGFLLRKTTLGGKPAMVLAGGRVGELSRHWCVIETWWGAAVWSL